MEAAKTIRMYAENNEGPAIVKDLQENYQTGYIKLFRSVEGKAWYKKSEYLHLWVHLLIKASHAGMETWLNGEAIKLKPGQLVTGRKKLSSETGIEQSKVERILKCFENGQQIEQVSTPTSRLISILNWGDYQKSEQPFEQRMNNRRTSGEQVVNTIQECKNDKNANNDKKDSGAKAPTPKFTKPDLVTIEAFFTNENSGSEAQRFFDYYTSNGWKVGRNPMKDWKAAARNWINKSKTYQNGTNPAKRLNQKTAGAERLAAEIRTELGFASGGE